MKKNSIQNSFFLKFFLRIVLKFFKVFFLTLLLFWFLILCFKFFFETFLEFIFLIFCLQFFSEQTPPPLFLPDWSSPDNPIQSERAKRANSWIMECKEFILPDWSPSDDPARPCLLSLFWWSSSWWWRWWPCDIKEGRLTLSFLHPEDVGDYSCTATNAHGNNTRSVYLEVNRWKQTKTYYVSIKVNLEVNRKKTDKKQTQVQEKILVHDIKFDEDFEHEHWTSLTWFNTDYCHHQSHHDHRQDHDDDHPDQVKVLNIQVFPVAIAATFVTLSWNTSQSLSRDFILQASKI